MKVLYLFLISLCGFHILFSPTLTISEARPLPQLPLNLEKWSNWLTEEMKIEPVVGKLLRPTPVHPPPAPKPNPPRGPSISSSSSDHNTASA
ncbi:hypothetical protein PIB30_049064 [Stylosanthes scabra]|uniref:Uncharacterized protein n=1 Tax=Stylosanthes scabra TaxID=79078 RepID=A0ABU6XG96_9FABA|nr:hypothetical protein [Stylosanthes scabra]